MCLQYFVTLRHKTLQIDDMISRSEAYQAPSLFSGLAEMLDPSHPLFRLANRVNWRIFDDAFEPLFCKDNGRPAKPIRLMVGLLILKHVRNLSDESIVEQWRENAVPRQGKE